MDKRLEDLDLNLLKLLRVLVETRNTSTAAKKLGISQTSVSRGMLKLRETFGDQLFIRKAHGVEPSELAERLAEAAEGMLISFSEVLEAYRNFEPENYQGNITIAFELGILGTFGQDIYRCLAKALPKARITLIYWQQDSLRRLLERKIDYMLHYSLYTLPQDIYTHQLSHIKVSLVARKNHPVLSLSSDWDAIHDLPLIKQVSDSVIGENDVYDQVYIAKGYKPNIVLATHSMPIIIGKLINSDAIKFGSSYESSLNEELASYPLPPMPEHLQKVSISGGYLQSKRGHPLNQYLHQVIQTFFDSIVQPMT